MSYELSMKKTMSKPICLIWLSWNIILFGVNCSGSRSVSDPLIVSAAADLTFVLGEIGAEFTKETDVSLVFNFGSSGQLAQQIENGAPVDLFLAANMDAMTELLRMERLETDSVRAYAFGQIVIWQRLDQNIVLMSLNDLLSEKISRIAIAHPDHAPYGVAARQALERKGIWNLVTDKIVYGENVLQAFKFAETGNVDVAIIARSLCRVGEGRWIDIPQNLYDPLKQVLAIPKSSKNKANARRFSDFILSPPIQDIFKRYGFLPPEETKDP